PILIALWPQAEAAANPLPVTLPLPGDKPRLVLNEKGPPVSGLGVSPDGKTLAAVCDSQECLKVWDTTTAMERKFALPADASSIGPVVFSPDGKTIAAQHSSREITFWDLATGQLHPTVRVKSRVGSIIFSPDSRALAV